MESQSSVFIRHYDKQSLKVVDVISGISPNAMRRVFGGWIFFAAVVGVIVSVAPDLSAQIWCYAYNNADNSCEKYPAAKYSAHSIW